MKLQKLVCTVALGALALGTVSQTAFAAAKTINSKGTINYKESTGGVDPIDPEKPGEEVEIEPEEGENNITKPGALRLDVVSHLKFGIQDITTSAKDYFAEPTTITGVKDQDTRIRGNYVQLTDQRAASTPLGWNLEAQVTQPFTNKAGSVLKGAVITYNNPFVNSTQDSSNYPTPDATVTLDTEGVAGALPGAGSVASAEAGKGWGTYTIEYGRPSLDGNGNVVEDGTGTTKATMDKSVNLHVPANVLSTASAYQAVIKWTISEL